MNNPESRSPQTPAVDLAVRLGMAAILVWLAMRVFAPFISLMIWSTVLAIALYPLTRALADKLGTSTGRASTLLVVLGLTLLGTPTVMLGVSFTEDMLRTYSALMEGTLHVPPPGEQVAGWPLVGPQIHEAWLAASSNLSEFLQQHARQIRTASEQAASLLLGGLGSLLAFLFALVIAGIFMAYAQPGAATSGRIFRRICGAEFGDELHQLSVATVRSVATGILGVAFIQAVLFGVGFLLAGIPAPGIFAVAALILGIMQVPALIFTVPAIIYIWTTGDGSSVMNILLTIYLVIAGLADNVLKPMLLGRGVAAPMPVILLGALGGMLLSGIIGLFAGAVILAIAYQVFMAWVNETRATDFTKEFND
mgnify:FL=1|jgi:predicted PurR-regulated permease PerM|tara:strand:+ start:1514 stop:2611 length:1098 start_codon:yes stop_codon:yes gene_type:complete